MRPSNSLTGRMAEEVARLFLEAHGMVVVGSRQRTPVGEIDIVGREGRETVFVEVKARSGSGMGTGVEGLDRRRAQRMRAAGGYWLANLAPLRSASCRFDLVVIELDAEALPRTLVRHRAIIE